MGAYEVFKWCIRVVYCFLRDFRAFRWIWSDFGRLKSGKIVEIWRFWRRAVPGEFGLVWDRVKNILGVV